MLLIDPVSCEWWTAPSLGLGWIASALERIGIEPEIIDCQITRHYKKEILTSLKKHPSVGISSTIGSISSALDISSLIREYSPKTRIIFGGPHPTAIYEKLIPKYADIVVLGEGEDTIVELMQEKDFSKIRGIAYWDGSLRVNPRRPFIEDLDRLGHPAWRLYDLKRYRYASARIPFAMITTSRGCPYNCIYCSKFVHGYKTRLRSLESVLDEIDYLKYGLRTREIRIMDDNFVFSTERVKQFCEMIIDKDYKNLRFALSNGIRADIAVPEMFELLAKAGFYSVDLGIDSGSQEIQNNTGRGVNLEMAKETIEILRRLRMKVNIHFIIGFPFDTRETMQKTVDIANNLSVDTVSFFIAVPFPGTEFYQIVQEKGRFLYDLTLNSTNFFDRAVYEMDSLKAKDVERVFRKAYRQFYFRPWQIWRALVLTLNINSLRVFIGLLRYGWRMLFRGGRMGRLRKRG